MYLNNLFYTLNLQEEKEMDKQTQERRHLTIVFIKDGRFSSGFLVFRICSGPKHIIMFMDLQHLFFFW